MSDRPKWEYRTVVATTAAQMGGLLPHHGSNGWELVSVIQNDAGTVVAFLKRPASRGQVDLMGSRASSWADDSL